MEIRDTLNGPSGDLKVSGPGPAGAEWTVWAVWAAATHPVEHMGAGQQHLQETEGLVRGVCQQLATCWGRICTAALKHESSRRTDGRMALMFIHVWFSLVQHKRVMQQ